MQNVKITLSKDKTKATIEIDLTQPTTPSKSGKTLVVASTKGNKAIEGTMWFIGLNAYCYASAR